MITEAGIIHSEKQKLNRAEWPWWILLLLIVALLWCTAYNRWTLQTWRTPVSYIGDSWGEMAAAKTFATAEMLPILPKYPPSLGAPFIASWNDQPITEEGIFFWYALLVRLFGVFAGSNLAVLSAHLLAAASFYFVCRRLSYERTISLIVSILFAMSGFAFARSLWHLVLTFYWHVPLGLLVVWWCLETDAYADKRKRLFCIAIAVLHGIQYIYYTGMFLQFLVLAALVCVLRRRPRAQVVFPLILVGVVGATFVLMNLDTLYYRLTNGPNALALIRTYSGLELYALRPVELLLPATHRLSALQDWTNRTYYSQTMFHAGENNSPYLGLVAIGALAALAWLSVYRLARGDVDRIPLHTWAVGWILVYSVIGGLNGLLGTFGLVLFRGTNRYSVVILALALLFLAREVTRLAHRSRYAVVCTSVPLLLLGLWDQLPHSPGAAEIQQVRQQVVTDGVVTSSLESKLPRRAMIFQLPVADYPEVGPIGAMLDYEHFRPYLQSNSLRFSYGSQKGRTRERWQAEVMVLGAPFAVAQLEKYGFSAVLINKKGYPDRAALLLAEFSAAGRTEILCNSDDFVGIRLSPNEQPVLPPEFDQNWSGLEGTAADNWRWSLGNANVIVHHDGPGPRKVQISFAASTLQPRELEVLAGDERIFVESLDPAQPGEVVTLPLSLRPGRNVIAFRSDKPGALPGTGDLRPLAVMIRNFSIDP